MLHDTCPVHPVDIRKRRRLGLLVHLQVNETGVVVEAPTQDLEVSEWDDAVDVSLIGSSTLAVERIVLD